MLFHEATQQKIIWGYLNSSLRIIMALIPMKEILECYPAHEPSRIPELRPEPELGQSSCNNNKNKQKSRDNKIELGAKNPEGFSSRITGLLEPGFDSHSESPSQEKS